MESDAVAMLSIDTRRHTIHIHQATYNRLGRPKVVQLLLDPRQRALALLCQDDDIPGCQGLRVYYNKRSCDLRSKALVTRIQETLGLMTENGSYCFRGSFNPACNIAVFSMIGRKTTSKNEEGAGQNDE